MALALKTVADRLLSMREDDGTTSTTGTRAVGFLDALAGAISAVEQEMAGINPSAFKRPYSRTLVAPSTGTVTIDGTDKTKITATTLPIPSEGATLMIASGGLNKIRMLHSDTLYRLVRALSAGGTFAATIYDDCWQVTSGSSEERIIGDVRADGEPILLLAHASDIARYRTRRDFGERFRQRIDGEIGEVRFCWPETSIDTGGPGVGVRLRFYPMPAAATVIEVDVVGRAGDRTAAEFTTLTAKVRVPGGLEESVFWPMLRAEWRTTPWFRPDAIQNQAINDAYKKAVARLEIWRPALGASNMIQRG